MSERTDTELVRSNGVIADETLPEQEPLNKHSYDVDSTTKVPPTDETRREKYERRLREKSGLSRRGLIIAACVLSLLFVCLIVIIVLASCWPTTPHAWKYPICRSTECLDTSAKMLGMMNTSTEPCQNFWHFSCGGWLSEHRKPGPDRSLWNTQEQDALAHRKRVRSLITTLPHTNDISSVQWKLKYFYESCMALEYIDTDKERPLKKIINELGGWHVLREFSVLAWDYKRTMEQLQSQHGVSPFFKVTVVPDSRLPADSTQNKANIIQISPSGLGFPDKSYYYRHPDSEIIASYKRYLKDVVKAMGATSVEAGIFSVDMFHFEKRIAEITPDREELEDPIRSYNPKTLSELKIIAPSIPLHEVLLAKFPRANIDDSTKIIVTSPSYLGNISLLISTTDRGSLNDYVMWQLTESYLPYLSQEFQDIVAFYRKETLGALQPVPRWEFCAATLQRFMGFALATLTERAEPEKERERAHDSANSMFETIRSSVEIAIKEAKWLEEDLRDQAMDKIISLGLQVGFPPDLLSDTYLSAHYAGLPVKRSDLFTNIGYGLNFMQSCAAKRLIGSSHDTWLDDMASRDATFYVASEHKVVVPMRLVVHPRQPPSTLYGSLGVGLSKAIVSSVMPPAILYKPRGDLLTAQDKAVNQSARAVSHATRCVVRDSSARLTNRTALDAVTQISGVAHAQKALSSLKAPHIHQPAMETLESDALFYVSYAQTLCYVSTREQDDLDRSISIQSKGQAMLQSSLRQLPNFAKTFACSSNSPYVAQRCDNIL